MARRTYNYIDYSPIAITLAAEENWPTLTVTIAAPHPSRRAISAIPAASPAARPSRKVTSSPAAGDTTPRHLHEASSIAVIVAPTSASQPLYKVVILAAVTAVTSASRLAHKTPSIISLYSS
ncbi:hypothetical protein ACLOJK_034436 [Asimina triloba]